MPRAGEDYSGYVIAKMLGRGGSATVYLARRPDEVSPVALKVLRTDHRDDADLLRLHREFDLARRIDHPHSVRVFERGPHWLSMQYVDGGNVTALPAANRWTALAQIAGALDTAHRLGIVHCDVKPTNILVHEDFSVRGAVLIDFGVAHLLAADMAARLSRDSAPRMTLDPARRISRQEPDRPGQVQASLAYVAPEILLDRLPSSATDQYSLACTAVELITGSPPFHAETAIAMMDAHLYQVPPRLSHRFGWLPRGFDSILAKALAKDPEARFESCAEFVEALAELFGN